MANDIQFRRYYHSHNANINIANIVDTVLVSLYVWAKAPEKKENET